MHSRARCHAEALRALRAHAAGAQATGLPVAAHTSTLASEQGHRAAV